MEGILGSLKDPSDELDIGFYVCSLKDTVDPRLAGHSFFSRQLGFSPPPPLYK